MTRAHDLAAAVLFGGRAQRLGGIDKSGLAVGRETILERILGAVRPAVSEVFAVGDRYGAAAAAGLNVVEDLVDDAGTLGGIYSAIVQSPCERTLILGCDMPFVTAAYIAQVAAVRNADAVMARDVRGYQPLGAIYSRACAQPIRERLDRGDRHAAQPPAGVRVVEIGPAALAELDPEGLLFVNVNTPHDYERARETLSRLSHRS